MSHDSFMIPVVGTLLVNGIFAVVIARVLQKPGRSGRALLLATAMLVAGVLGASGFLHFADRSLEGTAPLIWAWVSGVSLVTGAVLARYKRTMAAIEFAVALVLALEFALILLVLGDADFGLASAPVRILMVAPAVVGLWGYFGMSLGYLVWSGGQRDMRLGYEGLIGRRFLLSKSSPAVSTVTSISVVGVALGVWLVIVSLAILGGFESDLRRKIIGVNAHVQVKATRGDGFALQDRHQSILRSSPAVKRTSAFIEGEVAFAGNANYVGGILLGVNPIEASGVLSVFDKMVTGSAEAILPSTEEPATEDDDDEFAAPAKIPGVILGVEMAKSLNVMVGDRVNIISPSLEVLTPFGPAPRILGFEVAGIFATKMYEYDARFAYTNLSAARQFFRQESDFVSGIHVKLHDPDAVGRIHTLVDKDLGDHFEAKGWMERNQTLFSALKLERVVAFVVLAFIILVASFSIVNTLTMSVIEKQKEIAILMTMGARAVGIMKLFLVQGLMIGGFGAVIGGAAGAGTAWGLKEFGLWIPDDVYYIDSLPVHLEGADVLMVVLAALLIVWDFAVFPALQGSQLQPVEGLREG